MINTMAAANAVAVVTGASYVICRVLVWVAPGWLFAIAQSWFHTFAISAESAGVSTSGSFLLGLISSMVVVWLFTYAVVVAYGKLAK